MAEAEEAEEFEEAGEAELLGIAHHAEQDGNYNLKGDHFLVEGGNKTFVEGLAKDLNILYGHKVTEIEYSAETGVNVTAEVIPEENDNC